MQQKWFAWKSEGPINAISTARREANPRCQVDFFSLHEEVSVQDTDSSVQGVLRSRLEQDLRLIRR